jgi:hypothetical protein
MRFRYWLKRLFSQNPADTPPPGREVWGRVESEMKGSISARVFRAETGEWEDLGEIGKMS